MIRQYLTRSRPIPLLVAVTAVLMGDPVALAQTDHLTTRSAAEESPSAHATPTSDDRHDGDDRHDAEDLTVPTMFHASFGGAPEGDDDDVAREDGKVYEVSGSLRDFAERRYPEEPYLEITPPPYEPWLALRLGWWGVNSSGSKTGVGEWQGLDSSSPFFDAQGITSDGYRTLDFALTGTENESSNADVYYYRGPGFWLDVDYDRFIHRYPHPPLGGLPDANGFPPPIGFFDPVLSDGDGGSTEQPGYPMFGEDFSVGDDYAIRVQKLDAKFKGRLTDNVKWGLKVWGMRKEGLRRANSTQHCFPAPNAAGGTSNTCHVVSQGQRIDWLTMEIEPSITARFGWLTVEYSRTMRKFQQNDQIVLNDFTAISPTYGFQTTGAYAYVPENYTEIDRMKLHGQLAPFTEAYVIGRVGNTHNDFRQSDRKFYGVDARLMNNTFQGLSLTAFGKFFSQNNSPDTVALNDRYPSQAGLWLEDVPPQDFYSQPYYLSLVDRTYYRAGAKGRWRPFWDDCGPLRRMAVTGGYEYARIDRDNVTYELDNLGSFTQPSTVQNILHVGLQHDFHSTLSSYVRYRYIDTDYPLLGITHRAQLSLDQAINSNLPEHEDRIEIGGNWSPTDYLLVNASFWIRNSYNHSEYVNFDEDDYPLVVSAWYRPDDRWSFSGGYATFSNWISQDITLGREDGSSGSELPAWTSNWRYSGEANVINLGAAYTWCHNLTLTGGFEYVRGRNVITSIPSSPEAIAAGNLYTDIPTYNDVRINTYRFVAGVDYQVTPTISSYFRYNYLDFDDIAMPWNAGTANMFLGGVSAVY